MRNNTSSGLKGGEPGAVWHEAGKRNTCPASRVVL
jgi:hypothetical protein